MPSNFRIDHAAIAAVADNTDCAGRFKECRELSLPR
jgi:hypothetical protein